MISVVIPYYEIDEGKRECLKKCVSSLSGPYEFLIIFHKHLSFAKACNTGLALAHGEFICVVSDDVVLQEGALEDLCVQDVVASPRLNGVKHDFWGAFFCFPKSVYEKVGGFDERFEVGFYEDDDMIMRLKQTGIEMSGIEKVNAIHLGGRTMSRIPHIEEIAMENRKKFKEKWGRLP